MRRHDRIAIFGFTCLIVQLIVGTVFVSVRSARAQPSITEKQAIVNERLRGIAANLETRVKQIEDLKVDPRLAVLESMAVRVTNIEMLLYGAIVTLLGNLVMSVVMVRTQKGRRGQAG